MHNHCINKLLNLKDVKVTKIKQADHFFDIYIETEPSIHKCLTCGSKTKRIHNYRYQKIKRDQTIATMPFKHCCYCLVFYNTLMVNAR